MKSFIIGVACLFLASAVWAESNQTMLQTKTTLKEQERTKTELRLQEQTRDRLQSQDCENLMIQARNRTKTQAEYQENLEFMLSYALRNKVQSATELDTVSKFYQENKASVAGTAREKRNTLMVKAEARVKNQAKSDGPLKFQLKEQNNLKNASQYKSGSDKNMNRNPDQVSVIKQKRAGNSGAKR